MTDRYSVFQDRETEEYFAHSHNERIETLGDWKDRIENARALTRGEVPYRNPDGVVVSTELQITNLADQMPRDTARLVSEVEPMYKAPILGPKDTDDHNAEVRGAIARGYFEANRFDTIRPFLSMDLDLTGACFVCSWAAPEMAVPRFDRIDPFFAYPDVYNGQLLDLLVIQSMKLRSARLVFPSINFGDLFANTQETDDVTIMDYYGPKFIAKAIGRTGSDGGTSKMDPGKVHIIYKRDHGVDRVPVGFAMLPSPTGEFHGSLDQIGAPMATKNRLVSLITEVAHESVYAPWEERGVLNWNEDPGPNTIYHHNTALDGETYKRRIAPAPVAGELFGLLQFLETEQRGQLGYPDSRQGVVSTSQASASALMATQGQLTSIVRERQRLLSSLQEDLTAIAFQQDKAELDVLKPLPYVLGKTKTYTPSKDIGDNYQVRVEYGAGAGLDITNADQRLINFSTIGALSKETVLEQTNFISDARGEMARVENEEVGRILIEKWLSTPEVTPDVIGLTLALKKDKGISLAEAWGIVSKAMQENADQQAAAQQDAAAQQAAAPVAPGAPAAPAEAAPQPSPEFAKTPMHQVITG